MIHASNADPRRFAPLREPRFVIGAAGLSCILAVELVGLLLMGRL